MLCKVGGRVVIEAIHTKLWVECNLSYVKHNNTI